MSTAGTWYCACCGSPQPGVHYAGCASLGGFNTYTPPSIEIVDATERIARALERIADALERKP